MNNKFVMIFLTWFAVVVAYIFIVVTMPAGRELVSEAATQMEASANMDNFPGAVEFVESSPVWIWILPGLAGVVFTVIFLKREPKAF